MKLWQKVLCASLAAVSVGGGAVAIALGGNGNANNSSSSSNTQESTGGIDSISPDSSSSTPSDVTTGTDYTAMAQDYADAIMQMLETNKTVQLSLNLERANEDRPLEWASENRDFTNNFFATVFSQEVHSGKSVSR